MNWFRKPYTVCQQCKVHFEPAPSERHAELCPVHRKPIVEIEDRIEFVLRWAKSNWEKLEPQARAEYLKDLQISQAQMQNMYNAQMAAPSRSGIGDLMGLGNPLGF